MALNGERIERERSERQGSSITTSMMLEKLNHGNKQWMSWIVHSLCWSSRITALDAGEVESRLFKRRGSWVVALYEEGVESQLPTSSLTSCTFLLTYGNRYGQITEVTSCWGRANGNFFLYRRTSHSRYVDEPFQTSFYQFQASFYLSCVLLTHSLLKYPTSLYQNSMRFSTVLLRSNTFLDEALMNAMFCPTYSYSAARHETSRKGQSTRYSFASLPVLLHVSCART